MRNLNLLNSFLIILFIANLTINSFGNNSLYEISNELMCPVCQGQTVAESNSKLAISMREVIRNKISKGETKDEIIAYFVLQYGDSILSKPPAKGLNILLWIFPPFLLIGSLAFWILRIKKKQKHGLN